MWASVRTDPSYEPMGSFGNSPAASSELGERRRERRTPADQPRGGAAGAKMKEGGREAVRAQEGRKKRRVQCERIGRQ